MGILTTKPSTSTSGGSSRFTKTSLLTNSDSLTDKQSHAFDQSLSTSACINFLATLPGPEIELITMFPITNNTITPITAAPATITHIGNGFLLTGFFITGGTCPPPFIALFCTGAASCTGAVSCTGISSVFVSFGTSCFCNPSGLINFLYYVKHCIKTTLQIQHLQLSQLLLGLLQFANLSYHH